MTRMRLASTALWTLTGLGTLVVLVSSLPYLLGGADHPFVLERPLLAAARGWRASLLLHVVAGMLCLPAGLWLLVPGAAARWPRLHRGLGRAYAVGFFCVLLPTGLHLACHAKSGWAAGAGFVASNLVAAFFTCAALRAVAHGDVARHRRDMLRGYAQVASAISFRLYHIIGQLLGVPYEQGYVVSLWLSVLGNALLAEAILARSRGPNTPRNPHETRHSPDRLVADPAG